MVVMETVRAATLASSRRKERLAAKLAKPSQPLAFSSPREKSKTSFKSEVCPASPILPTSNFQQAPEELIRYRNQAFVAPEKLQIVKPLEGSVTLLKWKLLASPQLGGATSFFSNAAGPGVHMKKWRASGVIDGSQSGLTGTKLKSLSTADIDALDFSKDGWSPGNPAHKGMSASIDTVTGKQQSVPNRKSNSTVQAFSPTKSSTSLIGQVGSFLGSHFRFGTGVSTSAMSQQETQHSAGLSVLLDS